jgi:putative transposase
MPLTTDPSFYKRHRYPTEIISHAVWLYFRFTLSYRDVEELLAARGIIVSYETVRQWCRKFGQTYANQLRRRRSQPGDKWHLGRNLPDYQWQAALSGGQWTSMATC